MKVIVAVLSILSLNTANALESVSLNPGAKIQLKAGAVTEVSCQGSLSAQVCGPVSYDKNPDYYQIKIGNKVHVGVYTTIYDVAYAIKRLREAGLCQ